MQKKLNANVDFYSASTYYSLGIPIDIFTPIFAVSRMSGWTAHVLEQYHGNRLIRPPPRWFQPPRRPALGRYREALMHDLSFSEPIWIRSPPAWPIVPSRSMSKRSVKLDLERRAAVTQSEQLARRSNPRPRKSAS